MTRVQTKTTYSIRDHFRGKGVLVTGATGFLAKALVEKILRDLSEVRAIYLLIRPRLRLHGSQVTPEERLRTEILASSAFQRLREERGDRFEELCREKLVCVAGDLTRERLGLPPEAFRELARNVDVVVGSAATVVFDERLDLALGVNTLSPSRMLELAKAAGASYVHISTAYVSGKRRGLIPERLLDPLDALDAQLPPGKPRPTEFDVRAEVRRLQEDCRRVTAECEARARTKGWGAKSEEARADLRQALVSAGMSRARKLGWHDTYTYTKFLGEQIIRLEHGRVPTTIVRPSIIESSLREPRPGWLDGLRMADPLIIGFGKGRVADFPARRDVALDVIPVDLVVNSILAAAAHTGDEEGKLDLIQVASSSENPLTMDRLYNDVRDYFHRHPFMDRSGKPVPVPTWKFPSMELFRLRVMNTYVRPVKIANKLVDGPVSFPVTKKLRARLRSLNSSLAQLMYYVDIYGPYANLLCRFETRHARRIMEFMDPEERATFDFDPMGIRWREYLQDIHIPGLKRNILRMDGAGNGSSRGGNGRNGAARGKHADLTRRISIQKLEGQLPEHLLQRSPVQRLVQGSVSIAIKVILNTYLKIQAHGRQHVPPNGAFILASSHCSHLDTAIVREALGSGASKVHVMGAKDYFFNTPWKGWFFRTLFNTLPIGRAGGNIKSLALCRQVLDRGRGLLIYPEGTRSPGGRLQAFKPGIGILALELDCPVIPVHIQGTYDSLPRGKRVPRPGHIRVAFGEAVDLRDLRVENGGEGLNAAEPKRAYREAARRIHDAVARLAPGT